FQAEDGIRDDLVTGVQTCALPILPRIGTEPAKRELAARIGAARAAGHRVFFLRMNDDDPRGWKELRPFGVTPDSLVLPARRSLRSEERRVGKEWRIVWAPDRLKAR